MKLLKVDIISRNWLYELVLMNDESQVKFYWATIIVFIVIKKTVIVVIETVFIIVTSIGNAAPHPIASLYGTFILRRNPEKFPHEDASVLQWN